MVESSEQYFREIKLNKLGVSELSSDVISIKYFINMLCEDLMVSEYSGDKELVYLVNQNGFAIAIDKRIETIFIDSLCTLKYKTRDFVLRTVLEEILNYTFIETLKIDCTVVYFQMLDVDKNLLYLYRNKKPLKISYGL